MHAALVPITNAETSKGFSIVDFTAPCYFVASAGCCYAVDIVVSGASGGLRFILRTYIPIYLRTYGNNLTIYLRPIRLRRESRLSGGRETVLNVCILLLFTLRQSAYSKYGSTHCC
jgi:hypothetical protein